MSARCAHDDFRACPSRRSWILALQTDTTSLGTDHNQQAREIIATIPRDRLNAQERELIEPPQK